MAQQRPLAVRELAPLLLLVCLALAAVALLLLGVEQPLPLLGGLLGIGYAVLSFRRPDLGLDLVVVSAAFVYVFPLQTAGATLSVTDILLLAFAPAASLARVVAERRPFRQRGFGLLLGFSAVAAASMLVSYDLRNSLAYYLRYLTFVAFHVLMVDRIRDLARVERLLGAYLVATVVLALSGMVELLTSGGGGLFRVAGLASNANLLGDAMGSGALAALYFLRRSRSRGWRITLGGLAALEVAMLLLSYSRWGLVAFAVGLGLWLVASRVRLVWIATAGVVLTATVLADQGIPQLLTRRQLVDTSTSNRLETYAAALEAMQRFPLTGIGFDQFSSLYRYMWLPRGAHKRDPHNLYLKIGTETGLGGLALFLAFVGFLGVGLLRAVRRLPRAALDERLLGWAVAAFLVQQVVSELSKSGLTLPAFWLALGLAAGFTLRAGEISAAASVEAGAPAP